MNRFLLEMKVKENGYTLDEIAKAIEIDPVTFYRKRIGKSDFLRSEMQKLKKLLNLSNEEIDTIFFDK